MSTEKSSSLRRRLACDRCHSFKLKCPRPAANGNGICARCLKAGAACVYSPSMRGQVRAAKHLPSAPESLRDAVLDDPETSIPTLVGETDELFNNMSMDWTVPSTTSLDEGFGWISQLPPQTESCHTWDAQPANSSHAITHFYSSTEPATNTDTSNQYNNSKATNEDEKIRIVHNEPTRRPKLSPHYLGYSVTGNLQSPKLFLDLVNLSVTLEDLSRELPPFSVHDIAAIQQNENGPNDEASPASNQSRISPGNDNFEDGVGNAFSVTHKLADLYLAVIEQIAQRKTMSDVVDSEGGRINSNDSSLVYLLFSSHHRLIDLWHSMFTHAMTVLRTDNLPAGAERHKAHCAKMRMGSYVPSSSSTVVPMELIVVQELATHLIKRIGELIKTIDPAAAGSSSLTENSYPDQEPAEQNGQLQKTVSESDKATVVAAGDLQQRMVGLHATILQLRSSLEEAVAKQSSITKKW